MVADSLAMANIKTKTVHGIEIKKMTLRKYMSFAALGGKILPVILDKVFPGASGTEIFANALSAQNETLKKMLTTLLTEAPELVFEVIADMLDVETESLMDNPNIGLNELWDILEAWHEVNDLSDFFGRVSKRFPHP